MSLRWSRRPSCSGKPLEVKAPIDGVITERKSTAGESIAKDTEIYMISDPADLWVMAEIKERDIGQVKIGQDASFTVLAYPNESFHGKVVRIGNRVEEESRTLEVRIEVNNADGRLKPGMFADIEIVTTVQENVLLISDSALQTEGDDQIVFVALNDSKFEKRVVKTGMEQHGRVQVIDGVKPGEKVVTTGSFILKSEMLKGELGGGIAMINSILNFSVRQRMLVISATVVLIGFGLLALRQIPIDAFPDVTNVQVQVLATAGGMSPPEVEKLVTRPLGMGNVRSAATGGNALRLEDRFVRDHDRLQRRHGRLFRSPTGERTAPGAA